MSVFLVEAHKVPDISCPGYLTIVKEKTPDEVGVKQVEGKKFYEISLNPNCNGSDMFESEVRHIMDLIQDKGFEVLTARSSPQLRYN